jgi:hypothetical protein
MIGRKLLVSLILADSEQIGVTIYQILYIALYFESTKDRPEDEDQYSGEVMNTFYILL